MKCRVIQNDILSVLDLFKQTVLKPKFKQLAVSRMTILHWRNPFSTANPGYNVCPLELFPADFSDNCLSSWGARIFAEKVLIYAGFIDINKVFGGNPLDSAQK